jgi:excisionase family DNA binding protein
MTIEVAVKRNEAVLEPLYSLPEAAKATNVSLAWWRQKVFQRQVRFLKLGRRVLIPQSTIEELLKRGIVEPRRADEEGQ